jgi:hypothetical protein
MQSLWVLPASSRRAIVTLGMAAVMGMVSVAAQAQEPAAPQQPAAAPAQPDPMKFTVPTGAILYQVKKEKADDFETTWKTIMSKVAASDKADWKSAVGSIKIYKLPVDADPSHPTTYLFYVDPASNAVSYDPTKILYDSGAFTREEADQLYGKLKEAVSLINAWALTKIG